MVFNSHDHAYERTVPIRGITYVVSRGGGKGLYPADRSKWTAFSKSTHHAVMLNIDGKHLSLQAVEPDGTVMDRAELRRA